MVITHPCQIYVRKDKADIISSKKKGCFILRNKAISSDCTMQEQMSDPETYANRELGEGPIASATFNSITIKEKVNISLSTKAIPWFLQNVGKLRLVP
jgi:hypothetical protein